MLINSVNVPTEETTNVELTELNVRKRKKREKPQDWNKYSNMKKRSEGQEYNGKKKLVEFGHMM